MINSIYLHQSVDRNPAQEACFSLDADEIQTLAALNTHLSAYADYHDLDCREVVDRYMQFVTRYALDLKGYRRPAAIPISEPMLLLSRSKRQRTTSS